MFSKTKKIILSITLLCFVSTAIFVSFSKPAKAQLGVQQVGVSPGELRAYVDTLIGRKITQAGTIALVNAMNYFVQKLAYDAATWIASAGSGQKSLFDGQDIVDYLGGVARKTAMKFIEGATDGAGLRKLGFDFCAPNLQLLAKVKVGFLKGRFQQPDEPRCDWKVMVDNWDAFGSSFKTGEVLKNFGVMFEPGNSDLGFAFEFNNRVLAEIQTQIDPKEKERATTGGWQGVKDFISGKVTTPESAVKKEFESAMWDIPNMASGESFAGMGNALAQGAWAILPAALSNFTNTLLSKTMDRLRAGMFSAYDLFDQNESVNTGTTGAASPVVGRRNIQEVYSDFIKPKILSSSNYDPLIEFTTCSDNENEKQINNCVLDDNFAAAIRQASQGKPLSISEALKGGYIDGGKPLIASSDARNQKNNCYQEGYCYSNLVKLRKARILPVGFELAAELMAGGISDNLQKVVNNFNDCNASGGRDAEHLYCHLIDPNWVLKLPKTQCQARVYGPTLVSSAANLRGEICADPATCISEDESGNCTGGFGYCTKEQNIWRISADTCQEQFNSCLSYKARDNKVYNYLKNTVNSDSCTAENTGCRAYSVKQANGVWDNSFGNQIYLNKNAEKCDAQAAGCSELYSKANGLAYNLIPNPSFEKGTAGWLGGAGLKIITDPANVFDGTNAVNPAGNLLMDSAGLIKLELNTAYAFSGYIKKSVAGGSSYRLAMYFYTNASGASQYLFDPANLISTCKIGADQSMELSGNAPADYTRFSCAFLTPSQTLYAKALVGGNSFTDAIQLEEGSSATTFLASGYGSVESVNIKIAPSYLDCPAGGTNPECANYAPSCRADEAGCQNYAPKDGSPAISGVATVNDICPQSCVGYETYKQDATLFESEKFPNYLIPSTAKACSAQDVGCDEFTNLTNETKEYFGFVRQCIKPDATQDAVFYTWEGSDTTGFQLKSHRLKVDLSQSSLGDPVPAYILNTDPAACTKAIFTAPIGSANYNPDCREFYNAKGTVSYRLLSKTIVSTDECVDYRKTDSDATNCAASGGAWNTAGQYCVYRGYKAESKSCSAAANGCRAYSGAAAANLRFVFQDDFEANGVSGWTGGAVSAESLSAGGHSLKGAANATISKNLAGLVFPNGTYTISFWAKAPAGGKVNINFAGTGAVFTPGSNAADLKADWRFYEIGPFNLSPALNNPSLQISLSGGSGFYIDNIILKEASQKNYLIKNSWTTPAACDQTAGGLYLPQAMLGCKDFKDKNNADVYLKSFASLCRDEAVGCAAFANTQNGKADKNEIYNVICARPDKAGGDCKYNNETVCSVGQGSSICRFKISDGVMPAKSYRQANYKDFNSFETKLASDAPAGGYLIARDESTTEAPADNTIYAVANTQYACQAKDLGCSTLGQGDIYTGANQASVYYKNNPDNYSNLLCSTEAEGCESWTSNKGTDYFKVPAKGCEWRDAGGGGIGGWFKAGTEEACYPGFIPNSANGIWRNADPNYNGSVGTCPAAQDGCTQFFDPLNTSSVNKSGKPYYLLDNAKLKALESDSSCAGKASLEEGCVLFNKTSDPALKWNAKATYDQASQVKKPVAPIAGAPNNSNDVLKVTRDRECGEWLACKSSYTAFDPITNKAKPVCAEMGLCNKYQTGGSNSSCANFVVTNPDSGKILSADAYSGRKVGWNEKDNSGFSLGGKYPISDIKTNPDLQLVANGKNIDGGTFNKDTAEKSTCRGFPEQDSPFPSTIGIWDINKRLQSIPAQGLKNANICEYGQNCNCDYTKLTYGNKATTKYVDYGNRGVDTGVCQGGSRDGLSCTPGVAFDEDPTQACGKAEESGTCLKLQRQDDVIGWSGYCLERDLSTPINGDKSQKACLTWLPQDIVPGGRDIYNQFRTAGYIPPVGGGKYYCLKAAGNYSDVSPDNNKYINPVVTSPTYVTPWSLTTDPGTTSRVFGTGKTPILNPSGIFCGDATKCQFNKGGDTMLFPNDIYPAADVAAQKSIYLANARGAIYRFSYPLAAVAQSGKNLIAKDIYKDSVDRIEIRVGKDGYIHSDFTPGAVFYITANKKITDYKAFGELCDGVKITNNCSGESAGTGRLQNQHAARSIIDGDYWYFRYTDGGRTDRDYLSVDLFSQGNTPAEIQKFCEQTGAQTTYALRFHFNPDKAGLLDEVAVAACDRDEGNPDNAPDNNVSLGLYVHQREVCETIVDVAAFKNQAYTDRLWPQSDNNKKGQEVAPLTVNNRPLPYHYNYEAQPFGSAASDIAPVEDKINQDWYSYYIVGTHNFAGVPWSCSGSCGTAGVKNANGVYSSDGNPTTIDFEPNTKNSIVNDINNAANNIGALFSKIYNTFTLISFDRTYTKAECTPNSVGSCVVSTAPADLAKYPKIFSFDPNGKPLSNGQYRLSQENKFLINNQFSDIAVNGNQYPATMRFYFWADTDHMPIKSIKVDWEGDGVYDLITNDGQYKNHKPLCAKNNDAAASVCNLDQNIVCNNEPSGASCPLVSITDSLGNIISARPQSCGGAEKTFGNSPDACDESYFELQHTYVCTGGANCVYQPRVIITDNWGIDSTFKGKLSPATGPKITLTP
ncbi:MAG: hypothetical protein V1661_03550 [bacterium]